MPEGAALFSKHCAECHSYGDEILSDDPSAPDLHGFGTEGWIAGLLDSDQIATSAYFGNTAFVGKERGGTGHKDSKMVEFVTKEFPKSPDVRQKVATALATQGDGWKNVIEDALCLDCHSVGEGDSIALDLSGYASRQWTIDFIKDPAAEHFYGDKNDRMPSFGKEEKLSEEEIETVSDWILQTKFD